MEVNPAKQNINELFSTTSYHIDFYQREYKWGSDQVGTLINDLFYSFEQSYANHNDLEATASNVAARYSWYYLNTYITNKTDGNVFIVDGQQRLTTLSLMLIALYRMCGLDESNSPNLKEWLSTKIGGIGVGGKRQFWMAHETRNILVQALFSGESPRTEDVQATITTRQMFENFNLIRREFSTRLSTKHKLETFVYFFLGLVIIINLEVPQTDVAMVFEVINDRGIRLFPYEILKGKLLGEIDKIEVDTYADVWEKALAPLEARGDGEVDTFFRSFLKAQFSDTRKQGQVFDGAYHRTIFQAAYSGDRGLIGQPIRVKEFLTLPFRYYSGLFLKARKLGEALNPNCPELYYLSQLNRMDGHLMLILAACRVDDPTENLKVASVARAVDRAYVMLQLNRAYDSNGFQELLYTLHEDLRSCSAEQIEGLVDKRVLKEISGRRNSEQTALITYGQFKQVGYGDYNSTFLRYFMARIEAFLANGLSLNPQDSLYNFVRGTGRSNGYHIEHILSKNMESRSLYKLPNGSLDEVTFENERNRFGALLLLRGQDNQSAGNEKYAQKLKTYNATAPLLARSLSPDFYKANSALTSFKKQSGLKFEPVETFTVDALEHRSELLFSIVELIWCSKP